MDGGGRRCRWCRLGRRPKHVCAIWRDTDAPRERRDAQSFKIEVPEPIVTLRGGVYFFAPSLSFFKKLENPYAGVKRVKRTFLPGTETRIEAVPRDKTSPVFVEGSEVLLV